MGEWERERTDGMGQPGWDAERERVNREALAAVADWRAAHPTATLREIEVAVDAHLAAARARVLEAVALAGVEDERPTCPDCDMPMRWEGTLPRRLTTTHGQELDLNRRAARCPACGTGLFPPG